MCEAQPVRGYGTPKSQVGAVSSRGYSRCWYCGESGLQLTREHVVSEKHFGGRLVAPDTVCQPCNSIAGRVEFLVAQHPFVSNAVAEFMSGPGAKKYPQSSAVLPDGACVQVEKRPNRTEIIDVRPRQIHIDPDGTQVWEVAAGREAQFVKRRHKRGERVRAVGRPLGPGGHMELHYGIGAGNFAAWPRFVAKTTLATMSLVTDESWLDTDGALALQDVFHERHRTGVQAYGLPLYPWEQDRSKLPWYLLVGGEHVVGLWRDLESGEWRFGLTLFGYLVAEAELRDIECPPDEPTWIVSCAAPPSMRMSRAGFAELLAQRATQKARTTGSD
jgi:hypothetical protein